MDEQLEMFEGVNPVDQYLVIVSKDMTQLVTVTLPAGTSVDDGLLQTLAMDQVQPAKWVTVRTTVDVLGKRGEEVDDGPTDHQQVREAAADRGDRHPDVVGPS